MNQITKNTKSPLGKGLAALLGDLDYTDEDSQEKITEIVKLRTDEIHPGKMQPRQKFDTEKMMHLIESIRDRGVLQPILVRQSENEQYEIIAGERRWRAAKEAGLKEVPVVFLTCTDEEALELGLIENLQRDDLNAMEEAESLKRLMDEFKKTQDEVAKAIAKSRSYVANLVRLTTLPEYVKDLIRNGKLSAGHARTLIGTENTEQLVQEILDEKLSVRQTEDRVREINDAKQKKGTKVEKMVDPDLLLVAEKIQTALGLPTKIEITRSGGYIKMSFETYEQLDVVVSKILNYEA
ncbi:MAG: putative chromosome-partitioning protein ParB [Holosporales bacterium]